MKRYPIPIYIIYRMWRFPNPFTRQASEMPGAGVETGDLQKAAS